MRDIRRVGYHTDFATAPGGGSWSPWKYRARSVGRCLQRLQVTGDTDECGAGGERVVPVDVERQQAVCVGTHAVGAHKILLATGDALRREHEVEVRRTLPQSSEHAKPCQLADGDGDRGRHQLDDETPVRWDREVDPVVEGWRERLASPLVKRMLGAAVAFLQGAG